MRPSPKYELTIDLSVLNDLGINLYSNIPAVLSEAVANAWDADAEKVEISFDKRAKKITISDDGCGMTESDINQKYLKVGYKKRENGVRKTPNLRRVMGRKGIGKLSLFSIANKIEVQSVVHDDKKAIKEKNGLILDAKEIQKDIKAKRMPHHPEVMPQARISVSKGTQLVLTDLKTDVIDDDKILRMRLARRFSVIGKENNFRVILNGKEIAVSDRDYLDKVQYLWTIGEKGEKYRDSCPNLKHHAHLSGIVNQRKKHHLHGWIGTFDKQKSIDEGNNTVVIMARGKLIHEDILKDLKEGGLFTKYLIGELAADFVDDDDKPDIATSDRQNLKESDERFQELKNFVQSKILKDIQSKWTEWRRESGTEEALQNKSIEKWFGSLGPDRKKQAKKLFGTIGTFTIEKKEDKKELYKYGILAFEKLALKEDLGKLKNLKTQQDFQLLGKLFAGVDEIEATEYYGMVKGRLEVIRTFEKIIPTEKEKIIQKYIFDHLWLLDPSWERASTNKKIEEAVTKEFKNIDAKLTSAEKRARFDIRYRTAAGKHIIIELKRYKVKIDVHDLAKQVGKYRSALEKCLKTKFAEQRPNIEVICILGYPPTPENDDERNEKTLEQENARYITYDNLIKQTIESYQDFLDKQKKIGEIQKVIEQI